MKYLIITIILLIVIALILRRLKPYLIVARQMLGVVQTVRHMNKGIPPPNFPGHGRAPARESEKLERCRECGTWTPASRLTRAGNCSDCKVEVKKSESSKRQVG